MRSIFLLFILALAFVSCKKEKAEQIKTGHQILVKDNSGQAQANAEIRLYHSVSDVIADTNSYLTLQTDAAGTVTLPENEVQDTLICRATKGSLTSEFTASKYTATSNTYSIIVSQPSDDQLLCGHGSKKWLMTSYSINRTPQPYVVTSTLNADGTWTDTNGNSGTWQFANNNAELVYDYTNSGMVVTFSVLELTADFISLKANQSGMIIEMEMTAV